MRFRRNFSLILAFLMFISLIAGCSNQAEKESNNLPSSVNETNVINKEVDSSSSDKSPTVLKFGCTTQYQNTPVNWYETEIFSEILKIANVEIDYYYYDEDKFNLMLASRDFPDLVFGSYSKRLNEIINAKLALDLWPLLEEYAPNMLLDVYKQRNELVRELKGGTEKAMYFIPDHIGLENARGAQDSGRGYNARWDYYKEMGCPEITDDDTYIEILAEMVKNYPQTKDGKKTYATGLHDALSQWYTRAAFVKPLLLNIWTFEGYQYMFGYDDGELYNGYTNTERSAFWVDMRFYNKLYKRGLLDPDSFTQTSDEWGAKVKSGQYMATMGSRSNDLYNTMVKEDPNTLAGYIRIPSVNALTFSDKKVLMGNFPTWYTFIPASSKNWEAAMRLYNTLHDLDVQRTLWSGIEGKHWDNKNGTPVMRENVIEMFKNNSEDLLKIGFNSKLGVAPFTMMHRSYIHPDGYPLDLMDTDEMRNLGLTKLQQDFCEYYDVIYPSQVATKLVEEGKTIDLRKDMGQLIATAMEPLPSDILRILEKCNNVIYTAIPNLVMAETEEEFLKVQSQVLKDLENVDEATAWKWCLNEYNRAKAIVEPIFDESK